MPSAMQVRSACQSCHVLGRYVPVQLMRWHRGAWEWRLLVLCAICRELEVMHLFKGKPD